MLSRISERRVVHVNMLEEWLTPDAITNIVVIGSDEEYEEDKIALECSKLTEEQQKDLKCLLDRYKDVITKVLGKADVIPHVIDTRNSLHVRPPLPMVPVWKDQLREEV